MKMIPLKSNRKVIEPFHRGGLPMKRPEATDILALHAVSTLPDSMEARREILCALLAACPRSRYAERISVMLEFLDQHQACLQSSTRPGQGDGGQAGGQEFRVPFPITVPNPKSILK
jgi:hypothetical protein